MIEFIKESWFIILAGFLIPTIFFIFKEFFKLKNRKMDDEVERIKEEASFKEIINRKLTDIENKITEQFTKLEKMYLTANSKVEANRNDIYSNKRDIESIEKEIENTKECQKDIEDKMYALNRKVTDRLLIIETLNKHNK